MNDYLGYLSRNKKYQKYADDLQNAGGYSGALNKTNRFVNVWKRLANDSDFAQSQYDFILDKKFKPLFNNAAQMEGFDLEKRNPIVKDVLFSLAVQHGQNGAWHLIQNALGGSAKGLDDAALINKIYDERSNVDKYLTKLPLIERRNVKYNRYPNERREALKQLKE